MDKDGPRLKHLCDPNLASPDKLPRQLFPGYELEDDYDNFDKKYTELAMERFDHQASVTKEFNRQL